MTDSVYESPFVPRDEPEFDEDTPIYRVVRPIEIDWADQLADGPGAASRAFQDYTVDKAQELGYAAPGMSVAIGPLLDELALEPTCMLQDFDDSHGIVVIRAGGLRTVDPPVGIMRDPLVGRTWHGMVFAKSRLRLSRGQKRSIRDQVLGWVHIPAR